MNERIEEVNLTEIGESFGSLRLVFPAADREMKRSLEIYNQIAPLVCIRCGKKYELIDGFKRLRAARELRFDKLRVLVLETTERAGKAGMISLNQVTRSISDIEVGMILESLNRDGLTQQELGEMVNRDHSWVSKRISLVRKLSGEVQQSLKDGITTVSVARELTKVPRGTQPKVLQVILNNHLGKREAGKLIDALVPLEDSPEKSQALLENIWEVLAPESMKPRAIMEFPKRLRALCRVLDGVRMEAEKQMEEIPEQAIREVLECGRKTMRSSAKRNETASGTIETGGRNMLILHSRQEFEEEILLRVQNGQSRRSISKEFGISRNTVRRIIRKQQKNRDSGHSIIQGKVKRASKLDLYKERIQEIHENDKDLSAVRIQEKLQEEGYEGGLTILREYLEKLVPYKDPVTRFETDPGLQGQMDWSPYKISFTKEGKIEVQCFSYILGFSRRHYIDFSLRHDFHTLIRRHQDAFEYFGGVPRECLYDNEKTVVLRREAGRPVYNPAFSAFLTHYGCRPVACLPRTPQTKGKVAWQEELSGISRI